MGPRYLVIVTLMSMTLMGGCEKSKPPQASAQDIEAAKQDAQREVAEARAEASKDVKSAAKVSGSDSKVVADAKATGSYDVAMAKADGDRKIATEECLARPVDQQQGCKDQTNAAYESAAAAAKAMRVARRQ